jgi:uncharacterized protein YhbP (UPF0306 family)
MAREFDPGAMARAIIGSGLYMVLGTADEAGTPWTSPVYYAHDGVRRFIWVSRPERRHSRNIAARPEVSIVIFSSGAAINSGQAVYLSASAHEAADDERPEAVEIFSRRSQVHGGSPFAVEDVTAPQALRLYVATPIELWVLEPGTDNRIPVAL